MSGFSINTTTGLSANTLLLLGGTVGLAVAGQLGDGPGGTADAGAAVPAAILTFCLTFLGLLGSNRIWPEYQTINWLRHTPWRPGRPLPGGMPGFTGWAFVWLLWSGLAAAFTAWLAELEWPWVALSGLLMTAGCSTVILAGYGLLGAVADEDRSRWEVRKLHWALLLAGVWLAARRGTYGIEFETTATAAACVVVGMIACSVAGYWRAWRCLPGRVLEPPASGVVGFGGGDLQRRMLAENWTLWPAPVAADPRPAWWITLTGGGLTALLAGLAAALAGAFVTTKAGDHDAVVSAVLVVAWGIAGIVLLGRVGWNRPGRTTFGPPPPFRYLRRAGRTLTLPAWRAFWVGLIASLAVCLLADAAGLRAPEVAGLTLAAAAFSAATLPPSRRWCELCGDGVIGGGLNPDELGPRS